MKVFRLSHKKNILILGKSMIEAYINILPGEEKHLEMWNAETKCFELIETVIKREVLDHAKKTIW